MYSKLSALEGCSNSTGLYSPVSGYPSSLKVRAKTRRNLSPMNKKRKKTKISTKVENKAHC